MGKTFNLKIKLNAEYNELYRLSRKKEHVNGDNFMSAYNNQALFALIPTIPKG